MFVTSSVLLGSGSLGYSGREGRFFRPPPQRNLLRRELPLSPAFWNKILDKVYSLQCKSEAFLEKESQRLTMPKESSLKFFSFSCERERGCFSFSRGNFHSKAIGKNPGSISVSGQLPTYPSPNPTLTLTCYQLIIFELGEGRWAVAQILILIQNPNLLLQSLW